MRLWDYGEITRSIPSLSPPLPGYIILHHCPICPPYPIPHATRYAIRYRIRYGGGCGVRRTRVEWSPKALTYHIYPTI